MSQIARLPSAALPAVRQRHAIYLLDTCGFVTCREIQAAFDVSEATARRDIDALVRKGVAQRVRGGAMSARRFEALSG